jgi:hypothetical protein
MRAARKFFFGICPSGKLTNRDFGRWRCYLPGRAYYISSRQERTMRVM